MTEDEMVAWHHWLDGHESENAPGVGDGQGSLECCSTWDHKELEKTDQLNWIERNLGYDISIEVNQFKETYHPGAGHWWKGRLCMYRDRQYTGTLCSFPSVLLWT